MLHRRYKEGIVAITQPAHSWVSGQLARAWGNDQFGTAEPAQEMFLAAELHDVGFLEWEEAPSLNTSTGWPHTFMDLPTGTHLDLWTRGIQQMVKINRYAALLVSMHYVGLAERHPVTEPPDEAAMQQEFMAEQRAFQVSLARDLRGKDYYLPYCSEPWLRRNRQLIAIWDWMSLALGMGKEEAVIIKEVPACDGSETINVLLRQSTGRVQVRPWPFRPKSLSLKFEGRLLSHKFQDEQAMRECLKAAPVLTIALDLVP